MNGGEISGALAFLRESFRCPDHFSEGQLGALRDVLAPMRVERAREVIRSLRGRTEGGWWPRPAEIAGRARELDEADRARWEREARERGHGPFLADDRGPWSPMPDEIRRLRDELRSGRRPSIDPAGGGGRVD